MKVDLASALVGAATLGLTMLSAGAVQISSSAQRLPSGSIEVDGIPTPQQMVRVIEGAPFTVPEGKLFVVTGLGSSLEHDSSVYVQADGTNLLVMHPRVYDSDATTVRPVPPGLTLPAGSVVQVFGGNPTVGHDTQAFGYLVDA